MARRRGLHADTPDPTTDPGPDVGLEGVELLSDVADPTRPTGFGNRGTGRLSTVLAGALVLVLGVGLLAVGPAAPEPEPGRVAPLQFRFGDPFELDWIDLPLVAGGATSRQRPQPMVDRAGQCLGFARSDWPAGERHPSVAHCLDGAGLERLAEPDAVGVHRIAAGLDTWIFLFFDGPVAELEIAIATGAGSIEGPAPVHQTDSIAAVLVPTSASEVTIGWRRADGARYRAVLS